MRSWLKRWLPPLLLALQALIAAKAHAENPQLATCSTLPEHLGEAEKWRLKQALIDSFPVRYFDTLSQVRIEEVDNEGLLGPHAKRSLDPKVPPVIQIPQGFLPKQCRMILFQAYHLSNCCDGKEQVAPRAMACIRGGGAWAKCLDSALIDYLSNVKPIDYGETKALGLDFTFEDFLKLTPWAGAKFLMAHEAGHLVLNSTGRRASDDDEFEADLLGLQSIISDGTLPLTLLTNFATASLIDEVAQDEMHGSSACREVRALQMTRRLLPKVHLLQVAMIQPEKFAEGEKRSDLSDQTDLMMSRPANCRTYDPARFSAMEADLDDLLVLARNLASGPRDASRVKDFTTRLADFSPRSGEGRKWKTMQLFQFTAIIAMPQAQDPEGIRQYSIQFEPLYAKTDLTSLAPADYAMLQYFRGLTWFFSQPNGTSVIANARGMVSRFDAVKRYLPLDGNLMQYLVDSLKNKDVSALSLLMFSMTYVTAKIEAEGCGNAETVMRPLAMLNPEKFAAGAGAACTELRNSTIAGQVKQFGWTAD